MLGWIHWDPDIVAFRLPFLHRPIVWYGVLFALGFFIGMYILRSIVRRYAHEEGRPHDVRKFCDRFAVYVIVATLIGARLGHILFYRDLREFALAPWRIFMTWEGGLASHGGAIAILIALWLFSRKVKISARRLLDFLVVPTALAGCFIRMGNFINQEILGTPTTVPWAIVFMHPADGSPAVPRHPVQLYEGCFYLALFFVLWFQRRMKDGRVGGIFLVAVFAFRFLIEFVKKSKASISWEQTYLTWGSS